MKKSSTYIFLLFFVGQEIIFAETNLGVSLLGGLAQKQSKYIIDYDKPTSPTYLGVEINYLTTLTKTSDLSIAMLFDSMQISNVNAIAFSEYKTIDNQKVLVNYKQEFHTPPFLIPTTPASFQESRLNLKASYFFNLYKTIKSKIYLGIGGQFGLAINSGRVNTRQKKLYGADYFILKGQYPIMAELGMVNTLGFKYLLDNYGYDFSLGYYTTVVASSVKSLTWDTIPPIKKSQVYLSIGWFYRFR